MRGAVAATQASVPLPWWTSKSSSATRWMPLCLWGQQQQATMSAGNQAAQTAGSTWKQPFAHEEVVTCRWGQHPGAAHFDF